MKSLTDLLEMRRSAELRLEVLREENDMRLARGEGDTDSDARFMLYEYIQDITVVIDYLTGQRFQ